MRSGPAVADRTEVRQALELLKSLHNKAMYLNCIMATFEFHCL